MTETELLKNRWQELIDRCPLERGDAPFAIGNVSYGFFSVARYSGGCRIQHEYYIYEPPIDALIRDDVHRWVMQEMRKQHTPAQDKTADQPELFGEEK